MCATCYEGSIQIYFNFLRFHPTTPLHLIILPGEAGSFGAEPQGTNCKSVSAFTVSSTSNKSTNLFTNPQLSVKVCLHAVYAFSTISCTSVSINSWVPSEATYHADGPNTSENPHWATIVLANEATDCRSEEAPVVVFSTPKAISSATLPPSAT